MKRLIRTEVLTSEEARGLALEFQPGLYVHTISGGRYLAIALAQDHELRDPVVIYASMTHGSLNVRPFARPGEDSWTDLVYWEDAENNTCNASPRFCRVEELAPPLAAWGFPQKTGR